MSAAPSAPMLSQTNVKTINQRSLELVRKIACLEAIRRDFTDPILTWALKEKSMRLDINPTKIAWMLLRQGGALCHLLNRLRANTISKINNIDETLSEEYFIKSKTARENILTFLKACKEELYMTDDQLFTPGDLYADNSNTLSKAVAIAEQFMKKIFDTQRFNWDKKSAALTIECPELYGNSDTEESNNDTNRDKRLLVIDEMLDTERKYVADLELLHRFAEECKMDNVIDAEAYYAIFSNLDRLLDFQRKFLITMEGPLTSASRSLMSSYEAHIGKLFVEHEKEFSVYEIFCANHKRASEMARLEAGALVQKANILDPKSQLPSFLIKPVQRICKYPLLLRELIKMSSPDAKDIEELRAAEQVMKRVGDLVNEKQRKAENALVAAEFKERVDDWRGIKSDEVGELCLHEQILVTQNAGDKTVEKELLVYLFSNVLIMAKEGKGSMSISMFNRTKKMSATPLSIKGFIYMKQVTLVEPTDSLSLRVSYRENGSIVAFTLHFRTAEMTAKWKKVITGESERHVPAKFAAATVAAGMAVVPPGQIVVDKASRRKSRMNIAMERNLKSATAVPSAPQANNEVQAEMRLKVEYRGDCYLIVVVDLPSLAELHKAALAKIKADYAATGRPLALTMENMRCKYQDGADQVVLVDEGDLVEAIELHTNELKVIVSEQTPVARQAAAPASKPVVQQSPVHAAPAPQAKAPAPATK